MALENWTKVFDTGKGYCTYCGVDLLASISAFWSAQRDHVHSRAGGGDNEEKNMVIVCPSCNQALSRAKGLRTVTERKAFIQQLYKKRMPTFEQWCRDLRGGT
jgi:5-methylcytosine-specific restriction endonuclease McrA